MTNVQLFCYDETSVSVVWINRYLYSFKKKSDNI